MFGNDGGGDGGDDHGFGLGQLLFGLAGGRWTAAGSTPAASSRRWG